MAGVLELSNTLVLDLVLVFLMLGALLREKYGENIYFQELTR